MTETNTKHDYQKIREIKNSALWGSTECGSRETKVRGKKLRTGPPKRKVGGNASAVAAEEIRGKLTSFEAGGLRRRVIVEKEWHALIDAKERGKVFIGFKKRTGGGRLGVN